MDNVVETDFYGKILAGKPLPKASELRAVAPEITPEMLPIFEIEQMLMQGNATGFFTPTVCPVAHFFAPGVYCRQMLIPAGVCTIGHIHKYPCVTMISFGDLLITTQDGHQRYGPGATFESPAMVKRAVYALKDTLLTTIHGNPTDERDPEKIFASLIVDVYQRITGVPTPELLEDKP